MRQLVLFAMLVALPASAAFGQHASPPRCKHSVFRFAGQFLTGTAAGVLSAGIAGSLKDAKSYSDYGIHGDSYGSSGFLKRAVVASAVGSSVGTWLVAPAPCRAVVPALIGAGIASVPLWRGIGKNADAITALGYVVVGIPLQSLSATIAQTLAR